MKTDKTYITSDGELISYYHSENGKAPLLLIHGNLSSALQWSDLLDLFEEDYDVVAPSLRGFGKSSFYGPFSSLEELARDIKELTDFLELKDLRVIGWSLGGGVAMEYCAMSSGNVSRLVLNSSVGVSGYPMFHWDLATMTPQLDKPIRTIEELAQSLYYIPNKTMLDSGNRDNVRTALLALYATVTPEEDYLQEFITSALEERCLLEANYALLAFNITDKPNYSGFPGSGHIHALDMPVLILHGAKDVVVTPDQPKATAALLGENAELHILDGCAHVPQQDAREKWVGYVTKFLK